MTENKKIEAIKSSWYVWLFPFFAVLICAWLMFDHYRNLGPTIKINFEDGSSLQPDKTRLRYRGVNIGLLKKVRIAEDGKGVVAYVSLEKDAEDFAVEGSRFWIVSPKVSFQGISGLETLIEGTYIAVQPGNPEKDFKDEFNGKIGGESSDPLEDTVSYNLETANAESFTEGDSVTFRGVKIGSVTKVNLSKTSQTVLVQINVQDKYVKVIRTNSVFWRKVAVQANLGLFGSSIKINSLDSVLRGGIDVFTPDPPGEIAKANTKFPIAEAAPKDWEKWNPKLEFK